MWPKINNNYLLLHLTVFIWGWTAILGKAISIGAIQLVWLRILIALGGVFTFLIITRKPLKLDGKSVLIIFGLGAIVAVHWVCFYASVKVSQVAITLACFSSTSLFTALMEPLFFKRRVRPYEIILGGVTIFALGLIFQVEVRYKLGIALGVAASLTASIFGTANGVLVKRGINTHLISLYQLLGGFLSLSFFTIFTGSMQARWFFLSGSDWAYLLVLGLICTSIPYLISMHILKKISPFTLALTLNLETIYGIVFAFFIYKEYEQLSPTFFVATVIILSTIFVNAIIKSRQRRKISGPKT